jgi:hypothetical protein
MYDYYLGGKDNYPADREAAEATLAVFPSARSAALRNREFMRRAVRYLAGEVGVGQFLDIGTGIPTSPNLHEVARSVLPAARVVYADNDPIVLTHARALLTGGPEGATVYLNADLRDPEAILTAPELRGALDLSQPVALSLIAILHFVEDEIAYQIVRRFVDELAAGSYVVITHVTTDADSAMAAVAENYHARGVPLYPRDRDQVTRLFTGSRLIDPGLIFVHRWRNSVTAQDADSAIAVYGGVARVDR